MSKVIDASNITLTGCRVLFDTNVWILIQGFGSYAAPHKATVYSAAYRDLLKNNNRVIVTDYVLGEFCNRCAKIEYDVFLGTDPTIPKYKAFRQSSDFRSAMESVRDTCLHIIDDCDFLPISGKHYDIQSTIVEFSTGKLDFSDIIMAECCKREDIYLMTDDHDFCSCDVNLITANWKTLKWAGVR
jgi:predicted nucleic acid-binding protein